MNKKRTITLFGTVGLIALLVLSWSYVLSGRMSETNGIEDQRVAAEQQNTLLAQRVTNLEQKKEISGDIEATAAAVTRLFPSSLDQRTLFDSVRSAAKKSGLDDRNVLTLTTGAPVLAGVETVAVGEDAEAPATSATQLASVNLDIEFRATPADAVRFLTALENLDRAFQVVTVDVAAFEGNLKTVRIQGTLYMLTPLAAPEVPAAE